MANIVITGANRGIGFALVKSYVTTGNRVYAFCRNPDQATELAQLAANTDGRLTLHPLDMTDGTSIAAVASVLEDAPVDVLLNVAGITGGRMDSLLDKPFTEEDFVGWREAFEVMTIGPFRLTQALLPNLIAAKGKVMTVSSQVGASVWPYGGMYA